MTEQNTNHQTAPSVATESHQVSAPQHQYQNQHPYQQAQMPQHMPGMPLTHLTGGMKFGWAATGFLLGPVAILLAWLTNLSHYAEARNSAIKYSVIGCLITIAIMVLFSMMFGMAACTALGAIDPTYLY